MFGGDKICISWLFFNRYEQADHHPAMQQNLEKVEAIEVLHCTYFKSFMISVVLNELFSVFWKT